MFARPFVSCLIFSIFRIGCILALTAPTRRPVSAHQTDLGGPFPLGGSRSSSSGESAFRGRAFQICAFTAVLSAAPSAVLCGYLMNLMAVSSEVALTNLDTILCFVIVFVCLFFLFLLRSWLSNSIFWRSHGFPLFCDDLCCPLRSGDHGCPLPSLVAVLTASM